MLLSHHEVTEHILLPLAELQPEGNLFGAGIHGERITPEKGGGNQVIDATLADSEGQCFVICSVSGLNPKMQDTPHQSRTGQYPRVLVHLQEVLWQPQDKNHTEATQHSRPREPGSYQTRFYLFFSCVSILFFPHFLVFSFFLQSAINLLCLQLPCSGRGGSQALLLEGGRRITDLCA